MRTFVPTAFLLLATLPGISGCAIPLAPTQDAVDEYGDDLFSEGEQKSIARKEAEKSRERLRAAEAARSEENARRLAADLAAQNDRGGGGD